jgi:hypothetical protein
MFNKYTPRPWHQIFPFLMILITAAIAGAFPSWITATVFIVSCLGALATFLWIAWAGKTREEADYWWNIGYDIHQLRQADPDVWEAIGFKKPPEHVMLKKEVTGEEGTSPYLEQKNYKFDLSPAELQYMSNEILSGKKSLAEKEWLGTPIGSTRMRKIKRELKEASLIDFVNPNAQTQGMLITESGVRYFKKYASEWAIKMYEEKQTQTLANETRNTYGEI